MLYPKLLVLAILLNFAPAQAAEILDLENTASGSATEAPSALGYSFDEQEKKRQRLVDRIGKRREKRGDFAKYSTLELKWRTYDFERKLFDDADSKSLATGASLVFESGPFAKRFTLGATYFTSFKVSQSNGLASTRLLGEDGTNIKSLGELNLNFDAEKFSLNLYRQSLNLPYVNKNDSRMIPNTFEAVRLATGNDTIKVGAGYVTKMKERDAEDFEPLAEIAGVDGVKRALVIAAVRVRPRESVEVAALEMYQRDLFNTFYAEASIGTKLAKDLDYKVHLQYTDQRSVGDELLDSFRTSIWGYNATLGYKLAVLKLKYTRTGTDAAIRSPYGGRPHFNSLMLEDFDRAGERSTGIGFTYKLQGLGLPQVSLIVNGAKGWKAVDDQGNHLQSQEEWDFTLDYKSASDVWLRARYAEARRGNDTRRDFRLILNIPFSVYAVKS